MYPASFEYDKANTIEEAVELIAAHSGGAKFLAGGHSLLPMMKLRLAQPERLIDIGRLAELKYIREEDGVVAIGALATHAMIASSSVVNEHAPLLAQAAGVIGDVQVRNRGTIGGSIAHADPAADYPASLLATEAQVVAHGPQGKRMIPATEFFVDLFATALGDDELIVEIRVPSQPAGASACYLKYPHPASGFPIIGCAVMATIADSVCRDLRVAFTAFANKAFREHRLEEALRGKKLDENTIAEATAEIAPDMAPLEDHFASGEYRRQLAKVYVRRALQNAIYCSR